MRYKPFSKKDRKFIYEEVIKNLRKTQINEYSGYGICYCIDSILFKYYKIKHADNQQIEDLLPEFKTSNTYYDKKMPYSYPFWFPRMELQPRIDIVSKWIRKLK